MNYKLFTTIIFSCLIFQAFAQKDIFIGTPVKNLAEKPYAEQFKNFHIYEIDAQQLNEFAKSGAVDVDFTLRLGEEFEWDFSITPHDIRSDDYKLRIQTDTGIEELPRSENKTFRGSLQNNTASMVALTLDVDFIYGFVKTGQNYSFIEPAWYFDPSAPKNYFVVYNSSDVLPKKDAKCGVVEMQQHKPHYDPTGEEDNKNTLPENSLVCFEVDLAIASDAAMFSSYGSVAAVENHNIGVKNNVETDYDTDFFANEIQFVIVEQFVVTNGNNPWPSGTGSPDASNYLSDFRNWGQAGNFSNAYDIASLWTGLDLAGSTIGIAYVGAVCSSFRYNVLQDFTSNANLKRVMVSHEYGHNFNCGHDSGSGFIMSPSVGNTTTWSTQSVNTVNSYVPGLSCLGACGPPIPPTAAFSPNYSPICAGSMVIFLDESTDGPTSWNWSFPGSTPNSSTQQNPLVTYNNPGTYTVTLTVSNGNGSNTTTGSISVGSGTDFFHFNNFENGLNGWTIENPGGGATWTALNVPSSRFGNVAMVMDNFNTNAVGTRDALVSPTLDFSGRTFINLDIDYAYARFNNQFRDSLVVYVSTNNGGSYTRVFAATENGNGNFATRPDQGSSFVPQDETEWCFGTTYGPGCLSLDISAFAGSNQAKIKIENVNGYGNNMYIDNVQVTSDCQLALPPIALFSADNTEDCVPMVVNFFDESINGATSWNWTFPGGSPSSSTQQNPTVVYNTAGVYDVSLMVSNASGSDMVTESGFIIVEDVPDVNFDFTINGLTVNFMDLSTGGGTYQWNFGDNTPTSSQQNPTHTYAQGGTYTVTLIVSNNCGTDAFQVNINLEVPPVADFSSNVTSGCVPFNVQFTDQSTNNPTSWNWTFIGGTPGSSTLQNPTVTYATPGDYEVTLLVSNGAGSDEITQFDYILAEDVPDADFSLIVDGYNVDFVNNSTNATSFLWNFGDGMGTSTAVNPFYTYQADGSYTVTLEATNACGTDIFTQNVNISNAPAFADFSASTTFGCTPQVVTFFDNSPDNVTSWLWTFEGGDPMTSTDQNPTVTYFTAGTFDVTLEVSNAAGSAVATEVDFITIENNATADFSSTIDGLTATFVNNSTNGDTFAWDFGDDTGTSNALNPSYTYATDGVYTVTLTVTNACGSVSFSDDITIITPPTAGFTATNTNGCAPLTVQFTDQSSENTTSYQWTFAGGTPSSSTDQNPTVVYGTAGVYDVTLVVSNSAGSDTFTQTSFVTVNDVPTADFMSIGNNQTVTFTNLSTNAVSYVWDFGDNSPVSTDVNPTYTYAADGTYNVVLTATNACGSDMITIPVTVSTLPQAFFTADTTAGCAPLTVQFMDMSSANTTSWLWSFPGGEPSSSTAQNPQVTYAMAGTYDVSLVVSNSTGEDTFTQTNYITINTTATPGFTATNTDLMVQFTNTSTNAVSYIWDFGDNMGTSTEVNPSYTYATDGTYNVVLTAINACGQTMLTIPVTVSTLPVAAFSADTTAGCAPLTVQFMDMSSANATSWAWSFPGGEPSSSTMQNPQVVYNNPGVYDVTLTVTNSVGDATTTMSSFITVNSVPVADFTFTMNEEILILMNTSTGADSFVWDFGDGIGTSTEENPTYAYTNDGIYTVTLTATNDCGSSTTMQAITVVTPPNPMFTSSVTTGCVGQSVQYIDESSSNTTNWFWTFEGGDPATSNDQNPVVTYNEPGLYSVSLFVWNAADTNGIAILEYMTIIDSPMGNFSTTINDLEVNFNSDIDGATNYVWDFGDGMGSSTDPNPVYTYASDGTYTVTLLASNICGTLTLTETIVVATPPTADFTASVTTGCAPLEVLFTNNSSDNAVSYSWIFEGGTPGTSTEENPVVVYENGGTYSVTLIVSNAAGEDTLTQANLIMVNELPAPDFSFTVDGQTVTFINNSSNANSFIWDFGDNGAMSTEENPVYTYSEDGLYTITLTAFNDCGQSQSMQMIAIATQAPIALFEADTTEGCAPLAVQFQNLSSDNATSFEWIFEGGVPATSSEENPVVLFANPGSFNVTLVPTNALGSDTYTLSNYITVNPDAAADFDFTITDATVEFNNLSTNADSYVWFFGNGTMSMEENPVVTYMQIGTYEVSLIASGVCGVDTFVQEVVISVEEPIAFFIAEEREGCAPFEVAFSDLSTGNPTSYQWTFEGGDPMTSTLPNPIVTYNESGIYDVTLTVGNGAGSHTFLATQYIAVFDVPVAEFSASANELAVTFINMSTDADDYVWDFGDGFTSSVVSPSHLYDEPGLYTVTLTATNECGVATATQQINVMVDGLEDFAGLEVFQVFPNPNTGQFTLTLEGQPLGLLDLTIYNVIGQNMFAEQLNFNTTSVIREYDFSDWAAGIYVLHIGAGSRSIYQKIVIE